jgi:class 3 adenylate cyclase
MGLVGFVNQQVIPSCELYRQYFSDRLTRLRLNVIKEHRLATIVFINAVNLAAQMEADAQQTQNLLDQDFQLITQLSGQYEGQVLKSTSDGLFIYFPSTINAVNCAYEIQLTFRQMAESTSEPMLNYRIGIHLGDVVFGYTDVAGTGVNIAVDIQAETIPGGIGISQTIYDAVKAYLPLQPIAIGDKQFEGMEEPIQLYQLTF